MYQKIFRTFITDAYELEANIEAWLKENNAKEIDRSAPSLAMYNDGGWITMVAVTVTAQIYVEK